MPPTLGRTEYAEILKALKDENDENKSEQLQQLLLLAKQRSFDFSTEDIFKIFTQLQATLQLENLTYSVQCLNIIHELVTSYGAETKEGFSLVLEIIIRYLCENTPVKRKMSTKALTLFIEKAGDSDLVFNVINEYGLSSKQPNKDRIIACIPQLIGGRPEIISSCEAFKTLIEKLVLGYDNEFEAQQKSISHLIETLKNSYSSQFQILSGKLSAPVQSLIDKAIDGEDTKKRDLKDLKESPMKLQSRPDMTQKLMMQHISPKNDRDFVNVGQSVVMGKVVATNSSSPLRPKTHMAEGERPRHLVNQQRNATQGLNSINESINSKTYGVFPPKLIEDLNNEEDWKVRAGSIDEVSHIVNQMTSLDAMAPHFGQFLKFLTKLTNDLNFKIAVTALCIMNKLCSIATKTQLAPFSNIIIEPQMQKLGDSKIAVRQAAFQNFQVMMLKGDLTVLLRSLIKGLKELNWHIREECLMLLQTYFQEHISTLDLSEVEKLLLEVFPLLDDSKSKVKNAAIDVVATALKSWNKDRQLNNFVGSTVEPSVFQIIQRKLAGGYNTSIDFSDNANSTYYSQISQQKTRSQPASHQEMFGDDYSYQVTPTRKDYLDRSPYKQTDMHQTQQYTQDTIDYDTSPSLRTNTKFPRPPEDTYYTQKFQTPEQRSSYYNPREPHSALVSRASDKNSGYESYEQSGDNYSMASSNQYQGYSKYNDYYPGRSRESNKQSYTANSNQGASNSPFVKKTGNLYELSTASSSRSTYSRHPPPTGSTIHSFESSLSNVVTDKAKFNRPNKQQEEIEQQRIKSANELSLKSSMISIEKTRTYSAIEENELSKAQQQNNKSLRNKIVQQQLGKEGGVFLEYSVTKNLEEFNANDFGDENGEFINDNASTLSQHDTLGRRDVLTKGSMRNNPDNMERPTTVESELDTKKQFSKPFMKKKELQQPIIEEVKEDPNPYRNNLNRKNMDNWSAGSSNSNEGGENFNAQRRSEVESHQGHRKTTSQPYVNFEIAEKDESGEEDEEKKAKDKARNSDNKLLKPKFTKRKIFNAKNNEKAAAPQNTATNTTTIQSTANAESASYGLDYKKKSYLAREELTPIEGNVETLFKQILQDIKTDDWAKQFDAMNNFRRIMKHHINMIPALSYGIQTVTQEVLKLVESLRSSLAKNAMITLTEMCQELKKQLDPELESIISKLIKKGADTNVFIAEEVRKGIVAVCQNCSEARIISVLVNLNGVKVSQIKCNICLCIETMIERHETKFSQVRDYDKAVYLLANYMLDGALEVRNAAKKAFGTLLMHSISRTEIEKIVHRNMNELNYSKIVSIMDKELSGQGGNSALIITQTQLSGTQKKSSLLKKSSITRDSDIKKTNTEQLEEVKDLSPMRKAQDVSPLDKPKPKSLNKLTFFKEGAEFELLPTFFIQAENNEWRSRFEAVDSLAEFASRHSENLQKSKQILKFLDTFVKLMTDSNTKVSLQAINSFTPIVPLLKIALEKNSPNVIPTIANLLASTNANIKNAADVLWNKTMEILDIIAIIGPIANNLVFSTVKVKACIIVKLTDIADDLAQKNPSVVSKSLMPSLIKLLDENKPEIRNPIQKLLSALHSVMDKALYESVPANKVKLIRDALGH